MLFSRLQIDAVVTNAALHWVKDKNKVISEVKEALKNDGLFVGEFGGLGNIANIILAFQIASLSSRQASQDMLR